MTDTDQLAKALGDAGLLQDEYPDQMAQRSCTCTQEAVCGAHRLLARYDKLFEAFQQSNREKRKAKAALATRPEPSPPPKTDLELRADVYEALHPEFPHADETTLDCAVAAVIGALHNRWHAAVVGSATPEDDPTDHPLDNEWREQMRRNPLRARSATPEDDDG
jgi:hypothetical protein